MEISNEEIQFIDTNTNNNDDYNQVTAYLKEIDKFPQLTDYEEKKLASILYRSEARERFIEGNLKLVVSVAKRFLGRGLSFWDLIQTGNLGLIKAVDKFDISKGCKFSTFAFPYITGEIQDAIAHNISNRTGITIGTYRTKKKYNYSKWLLGNKLGRNPTFQEMANKLNISVDAVKELDKLQLDTISTSTPVGDEEESEFGDFIPDVYNSTEDTAIVNYLSLEIQKLFKIAKLTEMEEKTLILYYGLNDNIPIEDFEVIGRQLGCSREAIRKHHAKGMAKLRIISRTELLADYMNDKEQSLENIEYYRQQYKKNRNNKYKSLKLPNS